MLDGQKEGCSGDREVSEMWGGMEKAGRKAPAVSPVSFPILE